MQFWKNCVVFDARGATGKLLRGRIRLTHAFVPVDKQEAKMKAHRNQYRHIGIIVILSFVALFLMHSFAFAQWEAVTPPTVGPVWGLQSVAFPSVTEGWAVGAVTQQGQTQTGLILQYSDDVWRLVTPPAVSSEWYLQSVAFPSADNGWAVGWDYTNNTGVMLGYSSASGWNSITPAGLSSGWYISALSFPSADEGWAVGWNANSSVIILHYSGGVWSSVTPPSSGQATWNLYGVSFPSTDDGWAVGAENQTDGGLILNYSGGAWRQVAPPPVSSKWNLQAVSFPTTDEGWAVGQDYSNGYSSYAGVILHYESGSWVSVVPPEVSSDWYLYGVSFSSVDEGWAVGLDIANGVGVIFHYYYGSWSAETPPKPSLNWGLAGVCFPSVNEGWAVGGENVPGAGVILHYLFNESAPVIDKQVSNSIGASTATLGATIESNGGQTITAAGMAYGTIPHPEITGVKISTTTTSGPFAVQATGLTPNTAYYFRGYAMNAAGVMGITNNSRFTTLSPLWQNAISLGSGWEWLSWFGYFNTNDSPWIYHDTLGWLYPYGTSTDSIWFYDPVMNAFWWTSATVYPYVYRASDGTWLFYSVPAQGLSSTPRWFYNFSTNKWESD